MKVQSTLLAMCLLGAGFANAQSTNSSTTTTNTNTTTGTYQNQTDPNKNTNTGTSNTGNTGTNTGTGTGTYSNQSGTNMNTNTGTGTGTYSNQSGTSTGTTGTGTMENTGTSTGTNMNTNTGTGTGTNMNTNTGTGTGTTGTGTSTGTYSTGAGTTTGTGTTNNSTYSTTTTTTTTSTDASGATTPYSNNAMDSPGRFGIYAGINRSNFIGEVNNLTYDARYGYQIGVYGRSGGTVFGQLGAEFRTTTSQVFRAGTVTSSQVRANLDQQFLAIPAYVGIRIGNLAGLRLQAGAELSALIGRGKGNVDLGLDDVNRTQLNGLLDAGINLGPITLDVFYNHGLARIFDQGADFKRRMFGFNVGLRF